MTPENSTTKDAEIAALRARIAQLEAEVRDLEVPNVHNQSGWHSPLEPAAKSERVR